MNAEDNTAQASRAFFVDVIGGPFLNGLLEPGDMILVDPDRQIGEGDLVYLETGLIAKASYTGGCLQLQSVCPIYPAAVLDEENCSEVFRISQVHKPV